MDLMRRRKLSELPVVDAEGRPVGILDITDLLGVTGLYSVLDAQEEADKDTPDPQARRVA
jgi:CBS domain-containing protein